MRLKKIQFIATLVATIIIFSEFFVLSIFFGTNWKIFSEWKKNIWPKSGNVEQWAHIVEELMKQPVHIECNAQTTEKAKCVKNEFKISVINDWTVNDATENCGKYPPISSILFFRVASSNRSHTVAASSSLHICMALLLSNIMIAWAHRKWTEHETETERAKMKRMSKKHGWNT